jgi:hypothetical protein
MFLVALETEPGHVGALAQQNSSLHIQVNRLSFQLHPTLQQDGTFPAPAGAIHFTTSFGREVR